MGAELITIRGGTVTETSLTLNQNMSERRWAEIGEALGNAERSVGWWIGDWWNAGEKYVGRVKMVKDNPDWHGPSIGTCRTYGSVAAKFDVSKRKDNLSFSHYLQLASLPEPQAVEAIAQIEKTREETGDIPSVRMIAQEVKAKKRATRDAEMAPRIEAASAELAGMDKRYGVIMADPPWRFEPWSRKTGMDRAVENHYPTMTTEEICAIQPPSADDCVLFLWATAPMLLDAIDVMAAWDFGYKTNLIWVKPRIGLGYWMRNCHEVLLVGVRGRITAPPPEKRYDSVFQGDTAGHSVKPAAAAEMIEDMFPNAARLEMFARGPRLGWDVWGAEATNHEPIENDSPQIIESEGEHRAAARAMFVDASPDE